MKRSSLRLVLAAATLFGLLASSPAHATTITKANNTTSLNTSGSWVSGGPPGSGDIGLWDSTVTGANSSALGGNVSWGEVQISNPGGLVSITGNTLTLNGVSGTGIDMSAATQNLTISSGVTLGGTQIWDVGAAGKTLTIGGALSLATYGLTIQDAGNTTISTAITSTGAGNSLTMNSTGSLTLSSTSSSFTGGVTLEAGTLFVGTAASANVVGSGRLTLSGGTLRTSRSASGGSETALTNETFFTASTITIVGSTHTTVAGGVGGGQNELHLNGALTGSGTLQVLEDTVATNDTFWIGGDASNFQGTIKFDNSGNHSTLELDLAASNFSQATFTLSGINTSAHPITLATTATTVQMGALQGAAGEIQGADSLQVGALNTNTSYGGLLKMTGAGGLIKVGTGTLNLSGANTYAGPTTITAGSLELTTVTTALPGGIAATGGTNSLILNGGVLGLGQGNFLRNNGTGTTQVQWTGSGGFAAYGAPRVVNLNNDSHQVTWNSGSFVPTGDALILGAGDATNTVDFQNPIALAGAVRTVQADNGSAAVDAKLSGILSGTGASGLMKTGSGTLALTNASNSYIGATNVSAGVLALSGSGSISSSSSIEIGAGAAFDVTAVTPTNYAMLSAQLFTFDIDPTGAGLAGLLNATGKALNITNGHALFDLLGTLDDPFYVLADYGSLTGAQFASVTAPTGYTIDYNYLGADEIALVQNEVSAVPEPSTLALAAVGLLGLILYTARRR